MTSLIGPSLPSELAAAGVMNVSVFPDGTLGYTPGMSDADKAKAEAVLVAHDPTTSAPPAPPAPYSVDQATVVHRMTDDELTRFDAALAGAAATRVRRLWADERTIRSDGPFFALLRPALAAAFGEGRAAELLAAPAA